MGTTHSTNKYMVFRDSFCAQQLTVLQKSLLAASDELCEQMQERHKAFVKVIAALDQPVVYLEIALLRSSLLIGDTPRFLIEAFDSEWLFGGKICGQVFDIPAFTHIWIALREAVLHEAMRYMGQIPAYTAEKALLEMADETEKALAEILKSGLEQWLPASEFAGEYHTLRRCFLGMYRSFQHVLYEEGSV